MTEKNQDNYRWIILGVVTIGQASMYFGGLSIPPLAGYLTEALTLSKTEFGAIMSILFLGAAFSSFPSGRLSDIFGVRNLLSLSMIVMGLLVALLFLVSSYTYLVIIGFTLGLAYGTANPATNKAVSEWFHRKNLGTAMSIKQTSVPLGGLSAAILFPQLALHFGWRNAFLIGGFIIFLSACIPFIFYRGALDSPGMVSIPTPLSKESTTYKNILTNKDIILLSVIATIFAVVQITVVSYLILYLQEVALLSVGLAGLYLGLANASGILGRISWGIVSDRIFGGKRRIVLQIIGCISGLFVVILSLYPYTNLGRAFLVLVILLLGFTSLGWNGIYLTYLVELAGTSMAGTATGMSLSIVFLGNVFGPLIFGAIVDLTGDYTHAWQSIAILMACCFLTLFLLKEKIRQ